MNRSGHFPWGTTTWHPSRCLLFSMLIGFMALLGWQAAASAEEVEIVQELTKVPAPAPEVASKSGSHAREAHEVAESDADAQDAPSDGTSTSATEKVEASVTAAGAATATSTTSATTAASATSAASASAQSLEQQAQMDAAMDRTMAWLRTQQQENGSYGDHPGITAMVVLAFARSHRRYTEESGGPAIKRAAQYLVHLAKPDGSIFDQNLPNYNTALAIMALDAVGGGRYDKLVRRGQQYLAGVQLDERSGIDPDNPDYGGIGYGSSGRPDLTNLRYALEALATTGYDEDQEVFRKAIVFLERCQNRSESNDQAWAVDDGGFVYRPGESKAGGTLSYGSVTYTGLRSLMYAQVGKDDPRIQDAWQWIRHNWDLDSNPGMGSSGLYYYYQTVAQALAVWGEDVVEDFKGNTHQWVPELTRRLLEQQHKDGYWQNKNPRYWEDNKLLTTSRALLSLGYGRNPQMALPKQAEGPPL